MENVYAEEMVYIKLDIKLYTFDIYCIYNSFLKVINIIYLNNIYLLFLLILT